MSKISKLAILLFSSTLVFAGCSKGEVKSNDNAREMKKVSDGVNIDGLYAELKLLKNENGNATFLYKVSNQTDKVKKYKFSTGKQYDYTLYKNGEEMYTQSKVMAFSQAISEVSILPKNEKKFDIEIGDLNEGIYKLKVWFTPMDKEEEFKQIIEFKVEESKSIQ